MMEHFTDSYFNRVQDLTTTIRIERQMRKEVATYDFRFELIAHELD